MLLLANGEQAWEPVTQEDGVLTEDMIEEQQEILASLGSSKEATAMRARMQSASLLSDMSAFKGECVLCFVHCVCVLVWLVGCDSLVVIGWLRLVGCDWL